MRVFSLRLLPGAVVLKGRPAVVATKYGVSKSSLDARAATIA
ncbi:hypothetical protein ACSMXN_05305 [Jatrophihabitans sp. DSM 45814]